MNTLNVSQNEKLKSAFEDQVLLERFSLPKVYKAVESAYGTSAVSEPVKQFEAKLGKKLGHAVLQSVVRAVFLIELVKAPKIETTKFESRWADRLGATDPRFASFADCEAIFLSVISDLAPRLEDDATRSAIEAICSASLLPYEIPLDYATRRIGSPLHTANNFTWVIDDLPRKVAALRTRLLTKEANKYQTVFAEVFDKVKVKSYLTDRVLTGAHKTNREKRWETHPESVHFALRRTCWEIEYALINQVMHFENAPDDLYDQLAHEGVLPKERSIFRCPVTLDALDFNKLAEEVTNPVQGKSSFQVAHLNPLKAINDDAQSGHTATNMSWISADGNRIQGHLSLDETRGLLERISENYRRFGHH